MIPRSTHLVLLDIHCRDYGDNLRVISELRKHTQLTVGQKTGQHTACVVVVEELASELEVEFIAELIDTFLNLLGLNLQVLVVIETYFHIWNKFICFSTYCV